MSYLCRHPLFLPFIYSLPAIPLSAFAIVFFVYLPNFQSTALSIPLGFISGVFLVSRVWDALSDPIVGYLSDRIFTPLFARRWLWVAVSSPLLSLVFYLLCSPLHSHYVFAGVSDSDTVFFLSVLFFSLYTTYNVPYESWALELSSDSSLRERCIVFREGATLLGTIVAGAMFLPFDLSDEKVLAHAYDSVGMILSLVFLVLNAITLCFVPYGTPVSLDGSFVRKGFFRSVQDVFSYKPFLMLLFAFSFSTIASQVPAALLFFYISDVLHGSDPSFYVLLYFLSAGAGFPLWYKLLDRFGKIELWIAGLVLNTLAFLGVFFLGAGQLFLYGSLVALSGVGVGAIIAIPPLIQAEIIEVDNKRHHTRREGTFISYWSLVRKSSAAIAASLALSLVSFFGYLPGVENSDAALNGLTITYCLLPCLCNTLAIIGVLQFRKIWKFSL